MTIAFFYPDRALLPELDAYRSFFEGKGIRILLQTPSAPLETDVDVEWHFMGMHHRKKSNALVIHEYGSASVPPFAKAKDFFKKLTNVQPDFRLFFSNYVKGRLMFGDSVPFGIRDHGILSETESDSKIIEKEFDFVYAGSVDSNRKLNILFDCFAKGNMKDRTLLIISRDYQKLSAIYGHQKNIRFEGPYSQGETYSRIRSASFAINLMPDVEPFNQQTSAKFIDYNACRVPVISSDYDWVRSFMHQHGGRYFALKNDLSNFKWEDMIGFEYRFPDLRDWTWECQLQHSGVLDWLKFRFPEIKW